MKIDNLDVFVVGNPPPSYGGEYFVIVKLTTDSGIEGIGEVYSLPFHPQAVVPMIEDVYGRHVDGHDPFQIELLWRNVYAMGYSSRADNSVMGILSGIETACWDIVGKEVGRPVYDLLGGRVHDRLRTYTYIYPRDGDGTDVYLDPGLAAERAVEYVEMGFTALKFDPASFYTAFDPDQPTLETLTRCEDYTRTVRQAVGDRCDLLFGTHGQFTAAGAIRLARRLEAFDPLWFEEPVPPENVAAMAEVARATTIPVATGERLASKYEFRDVLHERAAAILQLNLGRVGGILEAKKIAGMAEAHYAQIAPHLYNGPVEGAACIQLDTCTPNFLIQEGILDWSGFHSDLINGAITWEDGHIIPPTDPGLGITLNEELARANPYDGDDLHLDVHPRG